MKKNGFTLLEILISLVLLSVLAAAVIPTTRLVIKRQKEAMLRTALLEVRGAIDRYKKAADDGLIVVEAVEQMGYPKDFDSLITGAALKKDATKRMRFLRKIPVDPMTGEAEWGMRSTYDDPDGKGWGRENLFDIYSLSDGYGFDETEYASW